MSLPTTFAQVVGRDDAETPTRVRAGEAPRGAGRRTDCTLTPESSVTGAGHLSSWPHSCSSSEKQGLIQKFLTFPSSSKSCILMTNSNPISQL